MPVHVAIHQAYTTKTFVTLNSYRACPFQFNTHAVIFINLWSPDAAALHTTFLHSPRGMPPLPAGLRLSVSK